MDKTKKNKGKLIIESSSSSSSSSKKTKKATTGKKKKLLINQIQMMNSINFMIKILILKN